MDYPLVSVWSVTYNHINFIGEALKSALEQDYPNLEVVVADDGSTDGTTEVINEFAQKYPKRLVALPSRKNQGISGVLSNFNRALKACRGKYIAFLEGDDIFLPGKISKQVAWLEEDDRRVLCGHDMEVFDSVSNRRLFLASERFPLRTGQGASAAIRYNGPFGTVATMVRASVLPSYGYDERLRLIADWKLWIDCLASGGHFGYVDGVLARYRRHTQSITLNSQKNAQLHQITFTDTLMTLSLVEASYPHLLEDCRYARARLFYTEGVWRLLRGEAKNARIYLLNSLRNSFVSWKVPTWLLLTFMPKAMVGKTLQRFAHA